MILRNRGEGCRITPNSQSGRSCSCLAEAVFQLLIGAYYLLLIATRCRELPVTSHQLRLLRLTPFLALPYNQRFRTSTGKVHGATAFQYSVWQSRGVPSA